MAEFHAAALPERLQQAFQAKQSLAAQQVYFAPVRHHSPACAYALQQYIQRETPQEGDLIQEENLLKKVEEEIAWFKENIIDNPCKG